MPLTFTSLGTRQLVTFYDPTNVSNSFSPQFNPKAITSTPSSVRKYLRTVNRRPIISGDMEYPPSEIKLTWDQIDKADFDKLRQFTIISPIVYVDNNDNGYLGVLVIDTAGQVPNMTKNVWGVSCSFLVIAPYQGQYTTINTVAPPVLSLGTTYTNGYIPNAYTVYVWSTVTTDSGESLVSAPLTLTTTAPNSGLQVTYPAVTSPYAKKVKLYWNTSNNSGTATQLTEIQQGFSNSFVIWQPYVAYSLNNPPTYNSAFSGYWAGGIWTSI